MRFNKIVIIVKKYNFESVKIYIHAGKMVFLFTTKTV